MDKKNLSKREILRRHFPDLYWKLIWEEQGKKNEIARQEAKIRRKEELRRIMPLYVLLLLIFLLVLIGAFMLSPIIGVIVILILITILWIYFKNR